MLSNIKEGQLHIMAKQSSAMFFMIIVLQAAEKERDSHQLSNGMTRINPGPDRVLGGLRVG